MTTTKAKTPKVVFDNWIAQVSKNSKASYERIVPQFFELTAGVGIDEITEDTLEALTPDDVYEKYVKELRVLDYKYATISNYLSVVRSYVGSLEENKVFGDISYQYLKKVALSTKRLKDDSENRQKMSSGDYESFYNWLKEREWSARFEGKGEKYALALKFMYVTAIRVHSTFYNIHWKNIHNEIDDYGNSSYIIYALDKGEKVNKKPISVEFYNELRETLYRGNEEDLVFGDLSKQSFTRLMGEFSKSTGIKITPHSIKIGAGTKLYKMTKDIFKVQRFLDHSDPKVTMRYIRLDDTTDSGSYMLSSEINLDDLKKVSYDDLVKLIEGKPDVAFTIINDAKRNGLI